MFIFFEVFVELWKVDKYFFIAWFDVLQIKNNAFGVRFEKLWKFQRFNSLVVWGYYRSLCWIRDESDDCFCLWCNVISFFESLQFPCLSPSLNKKFAAWGVLFFRFFVGRCWRFCVFELNLFGPNFTVVIMVLLLNLQTLK